MKKKMFGEQTGGLEALLDAELEEPLAVRQSCSAHERHTNTRRFREAHTDTR
jgi:hypothetical protein